MSNISVVCFAASYGVALALEISRLFFRSGIRGTLMIVFGAVGFLTQTIFLVSRFTESPSQGWLDWYLLTAWILAAVYLYLTFYHPKNPIGIFILPLVLGLIGVAYALPDKRGFSVDTSTWGFVHGLALLLGTTIILIGFVGGLMYLIQSERLKRKRVPLEKFRLPSLEWTEKITGRCIVISAILLGIGVLSGIALNAQKGKLPWTDPIVWSSGLLLLWLTLAMVFNMAYRPARQGRKVAYLTVASMIFLLLVLAITQLVPSEHPTRLSAVTVKQVLDERSHLDRYRIERGAS